MTGVGMWSQVLYKEYVCVLGRVWLLTNPMDWGLPGSSELGILQARILEWVAISSKGSFWPRVQTHLFCIAGRIFNTKLSGKPT